MYFRWLFYSEPNYNWNLDENKVIQNSTVQSLFSTDRNKFYQFNIMTFLSFRTSSGSIPFT